ncbi:hypothetical protein AO370_1584 [Moraxella catarrhalis]|uniref:Uncharacterized protein n=1 Tax=Moraxella catarrhalis TaxID=480 RepID=A0AB36DMZ2_MORCA|nr:hypothetical protein AO381_0690 [Moraxella catarrhalis]OAV05975.1 hypothetical protein AO379_1051 [Moraxella catarrhalis]OAV23540.1 hypothetical protein AO370_1584 [Moraxella catarrhalis]
MITSAFDGFGLASVVVDALVRVDVVFLGAVVAVVELVVAVLGFGVVAIKIP